MPVNQTAKRGLSIFLSAIDTLKSKLSPSDMPSGAFQFHDTKITPAIRQKANNAAVELLRELDADPSRKATEDEKLILSRYTGKGGNLEVEGMKGSQYEYYTPLPLADAMWALMQDLGFEGGAVLDPCAGTGIFAAGRPANVVMQSVELDGVSGSINAKVNDQNNHNVIVSPFEAVAARTEDNSYDAVITNVPFGSRKDRGDNPRLDIYADDDLDSYFVKRSIDKLKYGKLGVFLASTKLMTGASSRKFRQQISLKAEMVGAYRLPNKVFHPTGADVVTDIIVYRKHSQELTEKLENLYQNGQIKLLQESRVLDADIIAGKYFKTEGIKNVLGQSVQVPDWRNKAREIEAVISDESLPNIIKMIRRFPDSRIDLAMLDLAEMQDVPGLNDGDIRVMGGTTFEYKAGQWHAIKQDAAFNHADNFGDALMAFHTGMTLSDLQQYQAYCIASGQKVETWAASLLDAVKKNADSYGYWLVQFALYQALQTEINGKYAERYSQLSSAMQGIAADVKAKKYKSSALRTMLTFNAKAFDGADLSAYWYGTAVDLAVSLDAKSAYENAVYAGRADNFMVDVNDIRASDPDFDPLTNPDYAINADGTKVSLNRDYYAGNYGEFLKRIDAEIEAATDPKVRAKLLAQREKGQSYVNFVDASSLSLSLRATNIDLKIKTEFLSMYGGNEVFINTEGKVEVLAKVIPFEDALRYQNHGYRNDELRIYFLNRLLVSINNNQRLSLGVAKTVNRQDHDVVMNAFLKYCKEIDATFGSYLNANEAFMAELDQKLNDPMNKEMVTELDESPIEIAGFAPKFEGFKSLQTYQNAEIRRLSRRFEGITGFDVGLGKTMTAIAAAINLHNIGIKKRTVFVVPSHTISKWYRDITMTKSDSSDVLVIGSKGNTLEAVNSSHYGADLNLLIQSKAWRMIVMTSDAFTMLPLKDSTIEKYYERKLSKYDRSKDKDNQAYKAFMADKIADLQGSEKGRLPYFEDLGIDSIVFDEAQMFKNGDASEGTGNFNTIRGLSLLAEKQLSKRAISAKVKSDYVRKTNDLGDGVVLLSATPITNSPSEILTMLSLAVGEDKAKNILGGASIETVDDFLSTFANTESIEGMDITGGLRSDETFTGFKNVALLKNALHSIGNIQTAAENDLKIPEAVPVKTNIDLSPADRATLTDLKRAYGLARQAASKGSVQGDADDVKFLEDMCEKLGEPVELIAHPFNLIMKMQDLILMGESAVMERGYYIDYISPKDDTLTQQVVEAFNKKPPKFTTKRTYPLVEEADIKIKNRGKSFGDADEYEITVRAYVDEDQNRLFLTANDTKAIAVLFEIAAKFGLDLKPKLSAKLQAMIENFKIEQTNPMHNGHAKQIIFCDTLAMHHTIKQALIQYCGIEASRIAILNAAIKPDGSSGKVGTDDVQDIQDGFASDKYTVVIANKKADTGIDLQRGTQAIHHLTTGWTPDSLQQRNGRGVRQGNQQAKVRVYMYNANGSFDEYKLSIINGKSDWITKLMNKDSSAGGTLTVTGELSDDDLDSLIQADSQEAIEQLLQQRTERENQARLDRATKQTDMLLTIAQRSAEKAAKSETAITEEIIVSDFTKYVALLKTEGKTKKAETLEDLQQRKAAIVQQYDGYIPNNTAENWDRALSRFAEPRGGEISYVGSFSSYAFGEGFKSSDLVENVLAENKGVIHGRAKEQYKSIQRMAASTKEQLLKYEDSPYSADDRNMLFDGTAVIKNQKLARNGDIVKTSNPEKGAMFYGIVSVNDGNISYKYANSFNSSVGNLEFIQPNERAAAIQAFVDFELERLESAKIFDYGSLSRSDYLDIARFSSVFPEVREAVESKLKAVQENWLSGKTRVRITEIRHKDTKRFYWAPNFFESLATNNPDLVKAYNAVFDGIVLSVEKESILNTVAEIDNRNMDKMQYARTTMMDVLDDVFYFAQTEKLKINFDGVDVRYVEAFEDEFRNRITGEFGKVIGGSLVLPFSYDTILTDELREQVLEFILTSAIGHQVTSVEPFKAKTRGLGNFVSIMKNFALDADSPEALVKKYTKVHGGMGRFKNIKVTGVAFLGLGSFGREFKDTYKDDMKKYAESIGKKCAWDSRGTRWIVEPEVMLWMLKQDWFNMSETEFYEE